MLCACRTDAVASDSLWCPVGVLHVYFISSSIAEVSPHPALARRLHCFVLFFGECLCVNA